MLQPAPVLRRIRVCYFNTWAADLEPATEYLARVGDLDLLPRLRPGADPALAQQARLDCDWYAENLRCFAELLHPELEFLPARVCGNAGILELATAPRAPDEERWLILMAHQPQTLGALAPKVVALLRRAGVRVLYYAFDEASRCMPCFREIAPHLDVLLHDEAPLDPAGAAALRTGCRTEHRSWVANLIPFAAPFHENPEPRIVFLGSQLGLTEHRRKQLRFLAARYGDRLVALHDHSVSMAGRLALNRYQVALCPEGRKFASPAMSRTHTDRPFWSGCLGMVPVAEDSRFGGRLEELAAAGLIVRYPHGDLEGLAAACERALALSAAERRRIYHHFNEHETVGAVVANAIAAVSRSLC